MSVLTPLQREFLARFFAQPAGQSFYLTGGAALAEFYLHHRLSQDLDLFTQLQTAFEASEPDLATAAQQVEADIRFHPVRSGDSLRRCFLILGGEPELKVDVVCDPPPYFGQVVVEVDGVRVDSLENLAVGKLLAVFGRAYPRDFVDLYMLLKSGVDFERLIMLAKQKDLGFSEYYLGGMINQIVHVESHDLPKMLKPLDLDEMKQFFVKLAEELVRRSNPEQ